MNRKKDTAVQLDLNNPIFQKQLFKLTKEHTSNIFGTLRKLSKITWEQIYKDQGLKWEVIHSRSGPGGERMYSFRIGKGFRGLAFREGRWLRILSIHPDHDSAYKA